MTKNLLRGRSYLYALPLPLLLPAIAFADGEYPKLSGEILIEIENDYTFDADEKDDELNDLFNTTEAALSLGFTEDTSLNTSLTFEPIRDAEDDREFEDQGLFVEELYLEHDFGALAISAGKFNPAFGITWDVAPGIFGVDFGEEYELTEKLGARVTIPVEVGLGESSISLSAYQADRTVLSESLFNNRGNLDESDGGVSNTDWPENFVVSFDGEDNGTTYHLAARRQAKGKGDDHDEFGFVAGGETPVPGFEASAMAELAWFPKYDGSDDSNVFLNTGLTIPLGDFELGGIYSLQVIEHKSDAHLATVTLSYAITEEASIAGAYRYGHEDGNDSHTIGALFSYEFGF